ncbi:COX15/CtaA family protein [Cyclobacterium amurskyense]|uniref:Heme A synthase, cytochrome oxidase biogenesis protein Cox15-CtaA n=1 Tax=Cyclobacterium amurskyense TaxID=320787 RepID=A0A0H4PBM7_9BACT|nr:COX15/CtaA family protein [Cyclobacterium amurskyense]AKP51649.1 Heme A synthase, cytochrome oxidase biogenesis protein Cox15-CtaA [Cyclobacterium amurskyense]|tara:strand:- start:48263 stop:49354 length:1092 start_codon:yes stop_codon:yes gene_type:complete
MNQTNLNNINSFRSVCFITTVAVFLLILIGGVVRSTGAGMGCPDWPKCFGSWVPPTSVDQLPTNYPEIYVTKRVEKNERFASLLTNLGFDHLAEDIRNDKSILEQEPFNATKTWIEYVNRLAGAIIGLLIILTLIYSIKVRSVNPRIMWLSFLSLVLVLFQGWLGSIVVSTNLLQWMISVHMIVALLMVCLLLYIYHLSGKYTPYRDKTVLPVGVSKKYRLFLGLGILLMVVQIILGTQVREQIDIIAGNASYLGRSTWIDELGLTYYIHRTYSLVILALHIYIGYQLFPYREQNKKIANHYLILMLLFVTVILSGAIMAYFGIPAFIQPLHLFLGSLIIGFQYYIWLELGRREEAPINIALS